MNEKLLFHEGGQPVYIDDLKLMQDGQCGMWRTLLALFMGGAEACLLERADMQLLALTDDSGRDVLVGGGTLVVDGMTCPFPAARLLVPADGDVYVCIKRAETDSRQFEDGQERPCRETFTAYLSVTDAGAERAYRLAELPALLDLLADRLARGGTAGSEGVAFANGYSGSARARQLDDGDWEFVIDASTSNQGWDASADGYKGIILVLQDGDMRTLLAGRKSPAFSHAGRRYNLVFGATGVCWLWPEGVTDIHDDSVTIPLILVSLTFKLSETTENS